MAIATLAQPAETTPTNDAPRDPHVLPSFSSTTLTDPGAPLLYLPPLLSALPEKLARQRPLSSAKGDSSVNLIPQTSTRLPDIDPASLSLHKALHHFRPIRPDYAEASYAESFNWSELELPVDEEREWYCVAFRSKRKANSNSGRKSNPFYFVTRTLCCIAFIMTPRLTFDCPALYDADKQAHEEAVRNGGVSLPLFVFMATSNVC